MRALATVVLVWMAAAGIARAEGVRDLALPAVHGRESLKAMSRQVAAEVARSQGAELLETPPNHKLATDLTGAVALAQEGDLEDAFRALQSSVAAALDAPHRLPDDAALFAAMSQLASITLAKGDQDSADALFLRILEFDPAFSLAAPLRSPRVDSSLQRARKRARAAPALELAAVGSACADGASILIVSRGLADGGVELTRFDSCRLTATVRGSATSKVTELAHALDPNFVEGSGKSRPFYKSGWFLAGATATAVLGTAAAFFLLRNDEPKLEVRPFL